jgi:hypothetical protein
MRREAKREGGVWDEDIVVEGSKKSIYTFDACLSPHLLKPLRIDPI